MLEDLADITLDHYRTPGRPIAHPDRRADGRTPSAGQCSVALSSTERRSAPWSTGAGHSISVA
jgi:hypothetical protein